MTAQLLRSIPPEAASVCGTHICLLLHSFPPQSTSGFLYIFNPKRHQLTLFLFQVLLMQVHERKHLFQNITDTHIKYYK